MVRNNTLVTAVGLVDEPADYSRLIPMLQRAEETTSVKTPLTLAYAGYHSAGRYRNVLIAVSRLRCRSRPEEWHRTIPTTRTGSPTARTATHTGAPNARC